MTDDPEIRETNDIMHQWAYSFMPNSGAIYLVGYCKGCRNTFTSCVRSSTGTGLMGEIVITHTEVPRYGCDAPA